MVKHLSLAAGLAATLALAGCGSSHAVTKAQYVQRSDAICAKAAKADEAIPTTSSMEEVITAERRIVEGAIKELRALDRPPGMDAELDRWFAALDDEAEWLDRAAGGLASTATGMDEAGKVDARVRAAAARAGFHACAN